MFAILMIPQDAFIEGPPGDPEWIPSPAFSELVRIALGRLDDGHWEGPRYKDSKGRRGLFKRVGKITADLHKPKYKFTVRDVTRDEFLALYEQITDYEWERIRTWLLRTIANAKIGNQPASMQVAKLRHEIMLDIDTLRQFAD